MKTKLLISFLSMLMISSSAFADSAKMKVGIFDGQLFTNENVRIESVKFETGFNFCWGFCGRGLNTKLKQIKIQTAFSSDKKAVNFQSVESPSVRGGSFLGRFSYCGVEITVAGTEASGAKFSVTTLVGSTDDKGDCARGGATPYLPTPLKLISFLGNGNIRTYYLEK